MLEEETEAGGLGRGQLILAWGGSAPRREGGHRDRDRKRSSSTRQTTAGFPEAGRKDHMIRYSY